MYSFAHSWQNSSNSISPEPSSSISARMSMSSSLLGLNPIARRISSRSSADRNSRGQTSIKNCTCQSDVVLHDVELHIVWSTNSGHLKYIIFVKHVRDQGSYFQIKETWSNLLKKDTKYDCIWFLWYASFA